MINSDNTQETKYRVSSKYSRPSIKNLPRIIAPYPHPHSGKAEDDASVESDPAKLTNDSISDAEGIDIEK